ncbi:MAG TPA: NUDIX domain-containing protein [Chryseosolibacter sp.]|nr:NUDIX domain-containing protein [Chryseosolibacter sp.]
MPEKISCGILLYRTLPEIEFFLVHPGGPFFKNKNEGVWTIPKGEPNGAETFLEAAIREFHEETGLVSKPPYIELGSMKQKGGKVVYGWACTDDSSESTNIISNMFEMEWPPRSGKKQQFPEIDKASWFNYEGAAIMLNPAQRMFLNRLKDILQKS